MKPLRTLHRVCSLVLAVFIVFHLINHMMLFAGVERHIQLMDTLRLVYRQTWVECVLLLCVLFQVVSGLVFVWRRRGSRSTYLAKAQAVSGLYLAFFLLNHVGAVLFARGVSGLDTNVYFGIAGFHVSPFQYFFVPYYFLATLALFIHIASAAYWLTRNHLSERARNNLALLIALFGSIVSLVLILLFCGVFSEVVVPSEYQQFFG